MFRGDAAPVRLGRTGLMAGILLAGVLFAVPAHAQDAAQRLFNNDGGMVLNFIKPDRTADFEEVVGKLKEAMMKSEDPQRKQQAASWKVFKSPEPAAGGNTLYVFIIDPAVAGADYTVSTILAEAFPAAEVNELFQKYADAYAQGQNFVNLQLVADLGR